MFLDHRWVLFGAIRNNPNQDADQLYHLCLEIIDTTSSTCAATFELDKSVVKHASIYLSVDISVGSSAGPEEGSLTGSGGMPFAPDTSRGIITADVYLHHHEVFDSGDSDLPRFESYVFVLDVEDILAKVPSPPNLERHHIEWKDLSPSAAVFSYSSPDNDQYRIFSRHSYMAGFRYASPIQPLVPEDPGGPRCFFIYDFNSYRGALDLLPGAVLEDPDPKTGYLKGASEITREVIGGLSYWRMRFDLPTAEEDSKKYHISLTDSGIVLLEVCYLMSCSSEWFYAYICFLCS